MVVGFKLVETLLKQLWWMFVFMWLRTGAIAFLSLSSHVCMTIESRPIDDPFGVPAWVASALRYHLSDLGRDDWYKFLCVAFKLFHTEVPLDGLCSRFPKDERMNMKHKNS